MRMIISPAKKMRVDSDVFHASRLPQFLDRTEELLAYLRTLSFDACKALWRSNDALTALNRDRLAGMDLRGALTPALYAYEGLQYRYMAPAVFTGSELAYIADHLRILSGFYGLLRPFDGVQPYRLEMQARPVGFRCGILYEFWGGSLAEALAAETDCIVNLASREYSKAVQPHLPDRVRWVDCLFMEETDGKRKEKGTLAKMARGAMVRHMAEHAVETPEELTSFARFGFTYCAEASEKNKLVFLKGA